MEGKENSIQIEPQGSRHLKKKGNLERNEMMRIAYAGPDRGPKLGFGKGCPRNHIKLSLVRTLAKAKYLDPGQQTNLIVGDVSLWAATTAESLPFLRLYVYM
jgi:hypothetical protein